MSDTPLPSSFDGDRNFFEESRWGKFKRKLKEEPLIPIGCLGTCYALYLASKSIKAGDSATANQMFRYRIYGQAFTLVSLIAGSFYYNSDRILRKEYEKLQKEKKAKEKHEAWIRELEVRDREDSDWRERMGIVREAQKEEADRRMKAAEDRRSETGGGGGAITMAVKKLKKRGEKVVEKEKEEGEGEEESTEVQ